VWPITDAVVLAPRFNRVMTLCRRLVAFATGLIALALGAPSLAGAVALKPITGRLDKPGYTVIALTANGVAKTVIARSGSFSVVPPAATVSLHLRAPDGTYAGPIVLDANRNAVKRARTAVTSAEKKVKQAKRNVSSAQRKLKNARGMLAKRTAAKRLKQAKAELQSANTQLTSAKRLLKEAQVQASGRAKWAVLGVKAGAPLGAIKVDSGAGYALAGGLSGRVWDTWVNTARAAQAKSGVPIGAGNFGRVRSTLLNGAFMGDLDRDGVPDSLDVDINGNLILNGVDRSTAGRARASQDQPGALEEAWTWLWMDWNGGPQSWPVNADAAGITDDDIDNAMIGNLSLVVGSYLKAGTPAAAELDCGGLVYCSAGGTGMHMDGLPHVTGDWLNRQPFPACCDSNGDGFGSFDLTAERHGINLYLAPRATADQIRTGDVLVAHITNKDLSHEDLVGTLGPVFATVPALASYTDALGTHEVHYPITQNINLPVAAGPTGDVKVRLTFWRPQRRAIPEEVTASGSKWIDMGGLSYTAGVWPSQPYCPSSAYSDPDPSLTVSDRGILIDSARDQPADPRNTFSYTLNLTQCFAVGGVGWAPLHFSAQPPLNFSAQPVWTNVAHSSYSFVPAAIGRPDTP
jgi:hypothetical protein